MVTELGRDENDVCGVPIRWEMRAATSITRNTDSTDIIRSNPSGAHVRALD